MVVVWWRGSAGGGGGAEGAGGRSGGEGGGEALSWVVGCCGVVYPGLVGGYVIEKEGPGGLSDAVIVHRGRVAVKGERKLCVAFAVAGLSSWGIDLPKRTIIIQKNIRRYDT